MSELHYIRAFQGHAKGKIDPELLHVNSAVSGQLHGVISARQVKLACYSAAIDPCDKEALKLPSS